MRALLVKRWFLLLLLAGILLAWLRPDWLRPAVDRLEPRLAVSATLFLVAWGLESGSLYRALLRPGPALWAWAVSYSVVPALAWGISRLLGPDDLSVGLVLIASVPCTLASAAIWTRLAGGNEATALLVILLTTCTSWLVTPAWLGLATGVQGDMDTARMMRELVFYLVLPVGLGQLGRLAPPLAQAATRCKPLLGVVAQLLILAIILKAAVDLSDRLGDRSVQVAAGSVLATALACLGTHLAALATGFWGARLIGFSRPERIAVAFSCSQKTLPVALLLFQEYFRDAYPLAVLPLVFYHVGQLIVDTVVVDFLAAPPSPRPDEAVAVEV